MAKSNAERQKLHSANLSKDKPKFEQMKQKSPMRDNTRRKRLQSGALEQLRVRQKQASKKYRDELKLKRSEDKQSPTYKSRQSFGKAIERVEQSLPKEPNRRLIAVRHLAQTLDIIPKTINQHKRQQRQLPIGLKESIIEFYGRDDISYQMPDKRDYITVKDDDDETITLQKRILLNSIRETYELFLADNNITNVSLSSNSFGNLRPLNVLLYSHMSHRSCLCSYHENVNLLLKPLSKYIRSFDLNTLQTFSSALVCNEDDENCMFSRCLLCANNFDDKITKNVINPTEQIESFLAHVFIKRQQATHF